MSTERVPDSISGSIDGAALARAFAGGMQALLVQRDSLNAINVFPVPDGDTGTNMSLTMRAANEDAQAADAPSVVAVAKAAAQGALMGARGNSGVILSQILAGFAAFDTKLSELDGDAVAAALERGRAAAYAVVSKPREGTILTAITDAAQAARLIANSGANGIEVLTAAAVAAQAAADRTPDLLPVLKEAGVVDAGAQGLAILFDGMLRGLRGEATSLATDLGAIDASWLGAMRRMHDAGAQSGFCTEFVVSGNRLDADIMRTELGRMGDSLLVVGGGELVRVHVHTAAPDDALAYARTVGAVSHEKVENMEAQFQALAAKETAVAQEGLGVVAIGAGAGIEELFRSIGAARVVRGGQTMNPSAGDIRDAIAASGASDVIVLPNNKNVVLAAEQAIVALGVRTRVVPTRNIPQGVAALIAMNPEMTLDENVAAMLEAIAHVRTGEVTYAARSTKIRGLEVREGQPIALIEGELTLAGEDLGELAYACAERLLDGRKGAIVTLYAGEGASADAAGAIGERLRAAFACEVEVVDSGQPHYPYLIGVE